MGHFQAHRFKRFRDRERKLPEKTLHYRYTYKERGLMTDPSTILECSVVTLLVQVYATAGR